MPRNRNQAPYAPTCKKSINERFTYNLNLVYCVFFKLIISLLPLHKELRCQKHIVKFGHFKTLLEIPEDWNRYFTQCHYPVPNFT